MTFENKLFQLISEEINKSDDMINTLADLQANLTASLVAVLILLKTEGVDYSPEQVCLDIKRTIKHYASKSSK